MAQRKTPRKSKDTLIVCICGMAGSGKSTLAKKLAEKYGLGYCSGGDALKALAMEEGYKSNKRGWWESEEGRRFLERRGRDLKFDRAVDQKLMELAKRGNVVLDSWTMPWLLNGGFKIWLDASLKKRAARIVRRDQISLEETLKALKEKETHTKAIYRRLYRFRLGEDFEPFQLILDTDSLTAKEVFWILCMVVDNVLVRSQASQNTPIAETAAS